MGLEIKTWFQVESSRLYLGWDCTFTYVMTTTAASRGSIFINDVHEVTVLDDFMEQELKPY